MFKFIYGFVLFISSGIAFADTGDVVWYFQSFTDVTSTITVDMNKTEGLKQLCFKKKYSDLTGLSQPSTSDGDTAFGQKLGDFVFINEPSEFVAQCGYSSGIEGNEDKYVLYIYAEDKCEDDSEYDRIKRSCVAKFSCEEGETVLLSGYSSSLVQTAPNTVYISDNSPDSTCRAVAGTSKACTYNKPAYSHSCYSDSALSWDENGNMQGSGTGHCNYQYVNTGSQCTDTSSTLPLGWGGYSLTSGSTDYTCADGITTPGCPGDSGGGSDGGGDGTGSGGSGSGGSSGGTGSDGSDNGSDGSGTGSGGSGNGSDGSSSSASGTACGAALSCSGDAVQCAILAQQKKTACALSELTNVDQTAIQSMLNGEKFELEEKTIQATSLFERARFLPASCPAPEVLSFSFGTFSLSYDFLCAASEKISFLLVALASLAGMLIVFKD